MSEWFKCYRVGHSVSYAPTGISQPSTEIVQNLWDDISQLLKRLMAKDNPSADDYFVFVRFGRRAWAFNSKDNFRRIPVDADAHDMVGIDLGDLIHITDDDLPVSHFESPPKRGRFRRAFLAFVKELRA